MDRGRCRRTRPRRYRHRHLGAGGATRHAPSDAVGPDAAHVDAHAGTYSVGPHPATVTITVQRAVPGNAPQDDDYPVAPTGAGIGTAFNTCADGDGGHGGDSDDSDEHGGDEHGDDAQVHIGITHIAQSAYIVQGTLLTLTEADTDTVFRGQADRDEGTHVHTSST
ncbi:hypothetical protein [Streptomyces brasiliensis]|uniref:hypothetical protein n=1 Tax=Streptomyces brasiliensis TaxID=1954 RepID=UPI00166FFBC2|nr:hypothetical protein [Streptomyces brasiliensis]